MCFRIDMNAQRWKKRKVYKIVRIRRSGRVESPFYQHKTWEEEETYQIVKDAQVATHYTTAEQHAVAGVYVYKTYEAANIARRHLGWSDERYVILELRVNPKDFLYQDAVHPYVATYRRVRVAPNKHQPEMEFYA